MVNPAQQLKSVKIPEASEKEKGKSINQIKITSTNEEELKTEMQPEKENQTIITEPSGLFNKILNQTLKQTKSMNSLKNGSKKLFRILNAAQKFKKKRVWLKHWEEKDLKRSSSIKDQKMVSLLKPGITCVMAKVSR